MMIIKQGVQKVWHVDPSTAFLILQRYDFYRTWWVHASTWRLKELVGDSHFLLNNINLVLSSFDSVTSQQWASYK